MQCSYTESHFLLQKFLFSFPQNKKTSWMLLNNLPNVHEKNVKYMNKFSKCVLITLSVSLIKEPKCQHPSKNYIQFSALIFSAGNKFVPHNPSLNKQTLDSQTQHQLPQYDRPVCEICEPQEEMKQLGELQHLCSGYKLTSVFPQHLEEARDFLHHCHH